MLLRAARRLLLGLLVLAGLLLLSFALPIRVWRTGELPAPPLPLVDAGPAVELPRRVWIDTDAACGHGRSVDPDDCFALLLLLTGAPGFSVVGISTVHGNAPLAVTDSVTRALIALVATSRPVPPVYRGSAEPLDRDGRGAPAPAHAALRQALADGPLSVVALAPLTNLALALAGEPTFRDNVGRIVAVMGRRPGHLFHPAEGGGGGILFGHGPVFTDFNFAQDRAAGARVLGLGVPLTLVPYEAAREVALGEADLTAMAGTGSPGAWVVARARGWLDFWREEVGRDGFYPFDLIGAAYLIESARFDCAEATAWVGSDRRLWPRLRGADALLVGLGPSEEDEVLASGAVVYCPDLDPAVHRWLMTILAPP